MNQQETSEKEKENKGEEREREAYGEREARYMRINSERCTLRVAALLLVSIHHSGESIRTHPRSKIRKISVPSRR